MKKVIAIVLGGLAAAGLLLILVLLADFRDSNQSSIKQFNLSRFWGNVYLLHSGYRDQVNSVSIIYTDEVQKGYGLMGSQNREALSMWMENNDKNLSVYIHYDSESFDQLAQDDGWFDRDIYSGICLALESKTLGWEGCRDKAEEYYQWTQKYNLPGIIKQNQGLFGFQLVKPAYAQACSGKIICGKEVWTCRCQGGLRNNEICTTDAYCGGDPFFCGGCSNECRLDMGSDLNCNAIKDQWRCDNQSKADNCAIGCNNWGDNYCRWGGTPPSTPPSYGDVVTKPDNCEPPDGIANQGVNCSQVGLQSRYYEYTDSSRLVATGYCCGPNATNPAPSCGWWGASWDGYFIARETGWYQFQMRAWPRASFAIDLNQDDVISEFGGSLKLGEGFFYVGKGWCQEWRRNYWIQKYWSNTTPYDRNTNCDNNCPYGDSCQDIDFNTYSRTAADGNYDTPIRPATLPNPKETLDYSGIGGAVQGGIFADGPNQPGTPKYRTPSAYRTNTGTETVLGDEIIMNTAGGLLWDGQTPTDPSGVNTGTKNQGQANVFAARHLKKGYYKVKFVYHANYGSDSSSTGYKDFNFYYRPPGSTVFIETKGLTTAATCPNTCLEL